MGIVRRNQDGVDVDICKACYIQQYQINPSNGHRVEVCQLVRKEIKDFNGICPDEVGSKEAWEKIWAEMHGADK